MTVRDRLLNQTAQLFLYRLIWLPLVCLFMKKFYRLNFFDLKAVLELYF